MAKASDLLFQLIRDRSDDLASLTVDQPPPAPFPQADVYLLASTLQKAIRRGDMGMARRAGHQLLALDRSRLWRRVMTVGLEDIGIGDITVAAELVALGTIQAARRLMGGDRAALDVALARACSTPKERSADHLASILTREPVTYADSAALNSASRNALAAIVASSSLPWTRRLRAAALLAGHRTDGRTAAFGSTAAFGVFRELGVPELLLAAGAAYAARARDPLPILGPVAWLLHETDRPVKPKIAARALPSSDLVGDWPAYAFDPIHTRVGRRAVDLWLRCYLAKPPYSSAQVAAALWNGESAACDRTMTWGLETEIRRRAHRADLLHRGVHPEQIEPLGLWIIENWPALACARRAALASAARDAGKPAEASEQANLPLPVPTRPQRRG